MKRLILLFIIGIIVSNFSFANRPENIPSKLSEIKPKGWYLETAQQWNNHLQTYPNDRAGWIELLRASAYANAPTENLQAIAQKIDEQFPNSFEAYLANAKVTGWTSEGVVHLQNAIKLAASEDLLPERIMLHEFNNDREARIEASKKLFHSKLLYPSIFNYSYNVLMSVKDNGILILEGESTTIPVWVLQDVFDIRQDVQVINLELAENRSYLSTWLSDQQLNAVETNEVELALKLPEMNPDREFYYALTLPQDRINRIDNNLFVVGLASVHQEERIARYEELRENLETKFLTDYLTIDFNGEPKTATGRVYEMNYLLPFFKMVQFHRENKNFEEAKKWEDASLQIASKFDLKEKMLTIMNSRSNYKPTYNYKTTEIDTKVLDKKMKNIKGNLYAAEGEVTNREYWFFLEYLRTNGYRDLYNKCIQDLEKYDELEATMWSNYHYSPVNAQAVKAKRHGGDYLDYPIMDITYEAAQAYCEWLTTQYNSQTKKKFKKVKFRLPTKNEWQMAALGYKDFQSWTLNENKVIAHLKGPKSETATFDLREHTVSYPWFIAFWDLRNSITNEHNCYLANVKAPAEIVCPAGIKGDGFTLPSPIQTYFPNGMGLYDVVGNVAEMIDAEGVAMGGSWNHSGEESTISSELKYKDSNTSVGFRLFMEVIEE